MNCKFGELLLRGAGKAQSHGVHEEWKRKGVGSRVMNYAERAVRDSGYAIVWLTTSESHLYLPELYRHRGYEKTETYPLAYPEYDEIGMKKQVR